MIANLQFYLRITSRMGEGGERYGGFLLNCTKIPLIVLCWKSRQSTLLVDFEIESVFQAGRKKIKFYI